MPGETLVQRPADDTTAHREASLNGIGHLTTRPFEDFSFNHFGLLKLRKSPRRGVDNTVGMAANDAALAVLGPLLRSIPVHGHIGRNGIGSRVDETDGAPDSRRVGLKASGLCFVVGICNFTLLAKSCVK